jgi:phosphate transport system substrate-binding protein
MNVGTGFKIRLLLIMMLILCMSVAGCGMSPRAQSADPDALQGTLTVSGAWALYPLMVRWGEEFQKVHPDVRFDISAGGAGKGMADALAGAVDIGMVSREVYPEEVEKGAFWISVTKDAVFPTVSSENPALEQLLQQGVSRETFIDIFITGEITAWGQVVNQPSITDPIHVFTRSDACGAAATWAEYLDADQEDLLGVAVYGDPGLLDAVIKDPLGIGFNNLNYAFDMETGEPVAGAGVIPVDADGDGKVSTDEIYTDKSQAVAAIASGSYPSPPARDLNLVTLGKPTGLTKAFITWVLGDGQNYVGEAGYISLPQEVLAKELEKLD